MGTTVKLCPRIVVLLLLLCGGAIAAHAQEVYCYCEQYVYIDPASGDYSAYASSEWDGIDEYDPEDWYGWLQGTFTGGADQYQDGDGFLGGELGWNGTIASLGTDYEVTGDAGVEFDYDICECYYEEWGADDDAVPSAPTITTIGVYTGVPSAVTIQFGFSAPVLDAISIQQGGGPLIYASVEGYGGFNLSFDPSLLPTTTTTFTIAGYMYGQQVPGTSYDVTREDGFNNSTTFASVITGGDGFAPSFQIFNFQAFEYWSIFAFEGLGESPWDLATGGAEDTSTDDCVGTNPTTCPDEFQILYNGATNQVSGYPPLYMSPVLSTLPPQTPAFNSLENAWSLWVATGGSGQICVQLLVILGQDQSTVKELSPCLIIALP
jgi:hypothetical protein